jgi:hypothetical protein
MTRAQDNFIAVDTKSIDFTVPSGHLLPPKDIARQLIEMPDSLFYQLIAIRLNVPLCKSSIQQRNITDGEDREYYTIEYLLDKLFLELVSTREIIIANEGRRVTIRKYYHQALRLWRWIPITKPIPIYIVNLADLTPRTAIELKTLDKLEGNYLMKNAVGRIFENIDYRSYHMNIARRLKVRLDR